MIENAQLLLKPLSEGDWWFFLALHQNNQVMSLISDPMREDAIRDKFEQRLQGWTLRDQHWVCMLVTEKITGHSAGLFGFQSRQIQQGYELELGYMLSPDFQGKGYARQALTLLLAQTDAEPEVSCYLARVAEPNLASARLLENAGFRFKDKRITDLVLKGKPVADLIYERPAANRHTFEPI